MMKINKRNLLTYLLQGIYAFGFVWIMLGVLSVFAVHFEWWCFWGFLVCLLITPFYFKYMPKFKTMMPSIWLDGAKDLYCNANKDKAKYLMWFRRDGKDLYNNGDISKTSIKSKKAGVKKVTKKLSDKK